ncbi:protein serine/threonine kinase, putative [Entamoeba invadens IP1]|uniref:Protein serine/threonine kinase, putative n=1 Tax=Entamoeba invadens IP1 TaxID=370355 RepID=A0A0A1TXN7_ENTIV|nr:protein serine/threonine kinase, putative [Entamoeba invadens IP1]ELP86125.1 protein serine/threonine kinase, putative [Entamoeba invadens IP1]|eukprot:XP_004185471.1 protein serine/threonine kinase, putative [Entamoeba invadens IP1]
MILLFVLFFILTDSKQLKWCKYQDSLSCETLYEECKQEYKWSISSNIINLDGLFNGFSCICDKETTLHIITNNTQFDLIFETKNTIFLYSTTDNSFQNLSQYHMKETQIKNGSSKTGIKSACSSYCTNCENDTCTACTDGHYPQSSSCPSCNTACKTCTGSTSSDCTSCASNYYFSDSTTCTICTTGCSGCTSSSVCTSCYGGYYLSSSTCNSCSAACSTCTGAGSSNCNSCATHYYKTSGTCYKCDSSCYSCSGSSTYCTKCYTGDYLSNNQCFACHLSCENCKGDFKENCTTCNSHFYLVTLNSSTKTGKCLECDSICNNCNGPTNLNCTSCNDGYYYNKTTSTCNQCSSNCSYCTSSTKCYTCDGGFYLFNYACFECMEGCMKCSNDMYCSSCKDGYYISGYFLFLKCIQCDPNCKTCKEKETKCTSCYDHFYLNSYTCSECNSTCYNCSKSTTCTSCVEGERYLINNQCLTCDNCMVGHCMAYPEMCTQCLDGYYNDAGICNKCSSVCQTCKNTESTCLTCLDKTYLYEYTCLPCHDKCTSCDTLDGCTLCQDLYFPKNKTCHSCVEIENCFRCNPAKEECTSCTGDFIVSSGICVCPSFKYQNSQNTCQFCYNKIVNCKTCKETENYSSSTNTIKCTECYEPYIVDSNGNCVLCPLITYYSNLTKGCRPNTISGCLKQVLVDKCLACDTNYYLTNQTCQAKNSNCLTYSQTSCEECSSGITLRGTCENNGMNCKYFINEHSKSTCLNCLDNTLKTAPILCEMQKGNFYIKNGIFYKCINGEYLNINNTCNICSENIILSDNSKQRCTMIGSVLNRINCEENEIIDIHQNTCFKDDNCVKVQQSDCLKCSSNNNFIISNNLCVLSEIPNCVLYDRNECIKCDNNFVLISNECVQMKMHNCQKSNGISCLMCPEEFCRGTNIDEDHKFCITNSNNVKYFVEKQDGSFMYYECVNTFILYTNNCVLQKQIPTMETTKQNINNLIKQSNIKYENETHCILQSTKGCIKCEEKYYLLNNLCMPCGDSCVNCFNSTYCLSCENKIYFLNVQNKCELASDLHTRCDLSMPHDVGCAICKRGYFKERNDCVKCDSSCETCSEISKCLSCVDNYFLIPSEFALCQPFDLLTNCLNKTKSGCTLCEDKYYINVVNSKCYSCPFECLNCTSESICTLCQDNYILFNGMCKPYSIAEFCIKASNNYCTECENNYELSDDGLSCIENKKLFVKVGVPILVIFFVLIIGITITIIFLFFFRQHKKAQIEASKVCVFNMKKSNVVFKTITNKICSNKSVLEFFGETENDIDVNVESRELFCVGNKGDNSLKIQFTVKQNCDQYTIRTEPRLVTLKKNCACEFEMFITPNFSSQIEDEIACVCLDVVEGKEEVVLIKIRATTKMSTRIDYHELKEEKKIGEGTFGMVYKGKYRGNDVAIKRLKFSYQNNEKSNLNQLSTNETPKNNLKMDSNNKNEKSKEIDEKIVDDFENEVNMLNKFRSDYIVHFYGAVFVPSKVCMVTEYAQFGSLKDLMDHKEACEICEKLRIKICLDAAMGVQYLHSNGILHRDIKPDNVLIFSLNYTEKINAKLTDFGSSRNVNQMISNMTFTKGIGTPVYMAPEVLNKEKYTESADMYSLAIFMFECMSWEEAYKKKEFKFPWKIAEFVINGNRLEKPESMNDRIFNILEKSWKQNPKERISIEDFVNDLQKEFNL